MQRIPIYGNIKKVALYAINSFYRFVKVDWPMTITDETIDYVGILAKLELSAEEKEQAKKDMSDMLDYVGKLNELDTDNVEAMSHTFPYNNVFREDVVTNGDDRENLLKNEPEEKDGCYKVPKTFD